MCSWAKIPKYTKKNYLRKMADFFKIYGKWSFPHKTRPRQRVLWGCSRKARPWGSTFATSAQSALTRTHFADVAKALPQGRVFALLPRLPFQLFLVLGYEILRFLG